MTSSSSSVNDRKEAFPTGPGRALMTDFISMEHELIETTAMLMPPPPMMMNCCCCVFTAFSRARRTRSMILILKN
jgi:hypothetical protein